MRGDEAARRVLDDHQVELARAACRDRRGSSAPHRRRSRRRSPRARSPRSAPAARRRRSDPCDTASRGRRAAGGRRAKTVSSSAAPGWGAATSSQRAVAAESLRSACSDAAVDEDVVVGGELLGRAGGLERQTRPRARRTPPRTRAGAVDRAERLELRDDDLLVHRSAVALDQHAPEVAAGCGRRSGPRRRSCRRGGLDGSQGPPPVVSSQRPVSSATSTRQAQSTEAS